MAEMPIPAATAAMRPLTAWQMQALRNGSRARFRAWRISVRERLGFG